MQQEIITPEYIEGKIETLRKLGIELTKKQRKHIYSLTNKIAVNIYVIDLILEEIDKEI